MNTDKRNIKVVLNAILFSIILTSTIEIYNWFRGFMDYSVIREMSIFSINFIIGLIVFYFKYKPE